MNILFRFTSVVFIILSFVICISQLKIYPARSRRCHRRRRGRKRRRGGSAPNAFDLCILVCRGCVIIWQQEGGGQNRWYFRYSRCANDNPSQCHEISESLCVCVISLSSGRDGVIIYKKWHRSARSRSLIYNSREWRFGKSEYLSQLSITHWWWSWW